MVCYPGGSRSYIEPLTRDFKDEIRLNCPVYSVKRDAAGVTIESSKGAERYDYVIFACHSDQALALLNDRTEPEREVLQSMAYRANDVVLHTDTTLLPNAKSAWASWNYLIDEKTEKWSTTTVCYVQYEHFARYSIQPYLLCFFKQY